MIVLSPCAYDTCMYDMWMYVFIRLFKVLAKKLKHLSFVQCYYHTTKWYININTRHTCTHTHTHIHIYTHAQNKLNCIKLLQIVVGQFMNKKKLLEYLS